MHPKGDNAVDYMGGSPRHCAHCGVMRNRMCREKQKKKMSLDFVKSILDHLHELVLLARGSFVRFLRFASCCPQAVDGLDSLVQARVNGRC